MKNMCGFAVGDRVEVNLDFPHLLHRVDVGCIVSELIKYILHHRNQIPVHYERMKQGVRRKELEDITNISEHFAAHNLNIENPNAQTNGNSDISAVKNNMDKGLDVRENIRQMRENMKRQQEERRNQRVREKFQKKAEDFIDSCDALLDGLRHAIEVDGENILSLRILLGATPVSPKVIYQVDFPALWSAEPTDNFRAGPYLMRAIVTNPDILRVSTTKLPAKNIFVYIEKKGLNPVQEAVFVPTDEPLSSSRGTRIYFKLSPATSPATSTPPPESYSSLPATSSPRLPETSSPRLLAIFSSLPETFRIAQSSETPEYTGGLKREMTGPLLEKGKRLRFDSGTLFTPGCPRYGTDAMTPVPMELCTPAPSRTWSMDDARLGSTCLLSTDSGRNVSAWIDVCTPATCRSQRLHKLGSGSMNDCTPATKRLPLDLCTPAVRNVPLDLPSVRRDSAKLCTSGIVNSCTQGVRTDHMELCTPALRTNSTHLCSPVVRTGSLELCTTGVTDSMNLCTPDVGRDSLFICSTDVVPDSLNACTPDVFNGSMNLCTPDYINYTMDLCTPALRAGYLDLCIPNVRNHFKDLCTPAVKTGSMDFCTPAVKTDSMDLCTPGVRNDAMDLCTPAVTCTLGIKTKNTYTSLVNCSSSEKTGGDLAFELRSEVETGFENLCLEANQSKMCLDTTSNAVVLKKTVRFSTETQVRQPLGETDPSPIKRIFLGVGHSALSGANCALSDANCALSCGNCALSCANCALSGANCALSGANCASPLPPLEECPRSLQCPQTGRHNPFVQSMYRSASPELSVPSSRRTTTVSTLSASHWLAWPRPLKGFTGGPV